METKFVSKSWGFERWIANNELYCGKLLYVAQGRKCSVHFHKLKDETFFVRCGKLRLEYSIVQPKVFDPQKDPSEFAGWWNDNLGKWTKRVGILQLEQGSVFHVPPLMFHRFEGITDVELFEFSTQHFDEDSYRVIKGS